MHRKALPRTRLSSLYLFDAACRYAADIVRKKGSGYDHGDVKPPADSQAKPGSWQALTESASVFLQSASEIVEEIVLNTMEAVREEQQVGCKECNLYTFQIIADSCYPLAFLVAAKSYKSSRHLDQSWHFWQRIASKY